MSSIILKRSLLTIIRPNHITKRNFSATGILSASDWFKEVGPWPRTKKERERAARKYNLIPEDYEPFEELEAWGDYPKLPVVGAYNRDWYEDFDDIWEMHTYGEPMEISYDITRWGGIDPLSGEKPGWKLKENFALFTVVVLFAPVTKWIFDHFEIRHNQNFKQDKVLKELMDEGRLYKFPETASSNSGHH